MLHFSVHWSLAVLDGTHNFLGDGKKGAGKSFFFPLPDDACPRELIGQVVKYCVQEACHEFTYFVVDNAAPENERNAGTASVEPLTTESDAVPSNTWEGTRGNLVRYSCCISRITAD